MILKQLLEKLEYTCVQGSLDKEITEAAMPTHKQAIQMVLDALVNPTTGAIASLEEVDAVGHRVRCQ